MEIWIYDVDFRGVYWSCWILCQSGVSCHFLAWNTIHGRLPTAATISDAHDEAATRQYLSASASCVAHVHCGTRRGHDGLRVIGDEGGAPTYYS